MDKTSENSIFLKSGRKKSMRQTFSHIGASLALYEIFVALLILIISFVLTYFFKLTFEGEAAIALNWLLTFLCQHVMGFLFLVFLMNLKKPLPIERKKKKISLKEAIIIGLMSLGVMHIGSMISNIFSVFFEKATNSELVNSVSQMISQTNVFITIAVVVIIGPIIEEIVYRKMVLDRIRIYGEKYAVIFSSILFALAHGNFFQVFYSFGLGCIFGYLYIKTNNIKITIALHIFLNFCGTIIPTIMFSIPDEMIKTSVLAIYIAVSCIVSVLSLFMLRVAMKNITFEKSNLLGLTLGDKLKTSCLNVGMLSCFALAVYNFASSLNLF